MSRLMRVFVAAAALTLGTTAIAAPTSLDRRVAAATEILKDFSEIPEQAIPPNLLNRAYAVAVIPNVIKGGFIVGGSHGRGVVLVRDEDGSWSNPAFIRLTNLSIGWQAGLQGADLILVFKNQRGVEEMARGRFTLGGNAAASAGPVGRTAVAATDGEFKGEIYSYARSRGLFAGVSLEGGVLTMDHNANRQFYAGAGNGAASAILTDNSIPTPASAEGLRATLGTMAPRVNWKQEGQAQAAHAPAAPAQGTPARTYAIEETVQPDPETLF